MVRTTTGPAEKSAKTPGADAGKQKSSRTELSIQRNADLDDATWDRIEAMALSQNSTPADVVNRALTQAYGQAPTTTGFNSGLDT